MMNYDIIGACVIEVISGLKELSVLLRLSQCVTKYHSCVTSSQIVWVTLGQTSRVHYRWLSVHWHWLHYGVPSCELIPPYFRCVLCVYFGIEGFFRVAGIISLRSKWLTTSSGIILVTLSQHQECTTDGLVSPDTKDIMWLPLEKSMPFVLCALSCSRLITSLSRSVPWITVFGALTQW